MRDSPSPTRLSDSVSSRVATAFKKAAVRKISAFTLVELIVVITILAILATIGFLALSGYAQDAKDASVKANVRSVYSAIAAESALTGNSPRYYVIHDSGASLSGAFAFVDGNQVFLTGGDWGTPGTNYSAGNPDYVKLKLNPEKFKVSASGLPGGTLELLARTLGFASESFAAYDAKYLAAGAFDAAVTTGNKARTVSYLQIAGISQNTGVAAVSGNYPGTASSGSVTGLVRDPKSASSTGALVDGANSSLPASPVNGVCGSANKTYAFSSSSFGSDIFCAVGTAAPATSSFPTAGNSVSWTCSSQNNGVSPTCTASHAAAANCAAGAQTVNGRTYSVGAITNGGSSLVNSSFAVTGGTQSYSQNFACTDGAVATSGSETPGGITCTAAGYALIGGVCVPNTCQSIKLAYPASADGTYSIDPDGAGAGSAFNALCDMTTDGGGWTLVSYAGTITSNIQTTTGAGSSALAKPLFFEYGTYDPSAASTKTSFTKVRQFRSLMTENTEYLARRTSNANNMLVFSAPASKYGTWFGRTTAEGDFVIPTTATIPYLKLTNSGNSGWKTVSNGTYWSFSNTNSYPGINWNDGGGPGIAVGGLGSSDNNDGFGSYSTKLNHRSLLYWETTNTYAQWFHASPMSLAPGAGVAFNGYQDYEFYLRN